MRTLTDKQKVKLYMSAVAAPFLTVLFCGQTFAQGYPCGQDDPCPSASFTGVRPQMHLYMELYARYGEKLNAQNAAASKDNIFLTESGGTGRGVKAYKTAWFGKDDPRKDKEKAKIKEGVDETVEKAVAQIICEFPGTAPRPTSVNLYKIGNENGSVNLLGAAHAVIYDEETKQMLDNGYSENDVYQYIKDSMSQCRVEVTNRDGVPIPGENFRIVRSTVGTLYPKADPKHDTLQIEIDRPSKVLRPIQLKEVTAKDLVGTEARMIASHHDVTIEKDTPEGKKIYHPKVYSRGEFKRMDSRNLDSHIAGIILDDVPTTGMASGALLYNPEGYGVAIHTSGVNRDQGDYDGYRRYNTAIVLDSETMSILRRF